MSDTPDLESLARRYLDLWQDQMARMARDPATNEAVTRTFALMTKSAEAFAAAKSTDWQSVAAAWGDTARDAQHSADPATAPQEATPGAAPAAAVPGDGSNDLSRLVERIAGLEARVADLERQLAAAQQPARRPAARRSRRPADGDPAP